MDDVVLGKVEIIERCVRRVREVHDGDSAAFRLDLTRQESVLLNLQRATEAAIDLATPLRGMVGFRSVEVHDYRKRDLDVVEAIVARHLDDLLAFARLALRARGAE